MCSIVAMRIHVYVEVHWKLFICKSLAVAPAGMVSREQYSGAGFMAADHTQSTPEGYNRAGNLKDVCNE